MSAETVKIAVNMSMSSQGVSESDELDTELTREEWDALTDEQREELGDTLAKEWFENLVQYGWDVADGGEG